MNIVGADELSKPAEETEPGGRRRSRWWSWLEDGKFLGTVIRHLDKPWTKGNGPSSSSGKVIITDSLHARHRSPFTEDFKIAVLT